MRCPKLAPKPAAEYFLNISFRLRPPRSTRRRATRWRGISSPFPVLARAAIRRTFAPALDLNDSGGEIALSGPAFALRFSKQEGVITSYTHKGRTLIERGPRPDFWRAPTDNDNGARKSVKTDFDKDPTLDLSFWKNAGPSWAIRGVKVERISGNTARISVAAELPEAGAKYAVRYLVYGSGEIVVESNYSPGDKTLPMMPRFGSELILAPGLENITWYGRGPIETYIDRQFERIGVYKSTVDEQWVEYMRPQENGNKIGVRWFTLTDSQGAGLRISGSPEISVAARHYAKEDIQRAGYTFQMQRHPQIYLNVDAIQMGVGGIDSWSRNAWPMAPYRIDPAQPHSYRFTISPK